MRFTLLCLLLAACGGAAAVAPVCPTCPVCPAPAEPTPPPDPGPPPEPELALAPVGFADLPGWSDDAVGEALPALVRSCGKLKGRADADPLGRAPAGGTVAAWRAACAAAAAVDPADRAAARAFFERAFVPWAASNRGDPLGRFTGYYEESLRGARRRGGAYQVPLYKRPPELISVDLDDFLSDGKARRLWGKLVGKRLRPYFTRAEIAGGALAGRGLELLWVDDATAAFFTEVQGSARVTLDTGEVTRVGVAGKNGHRYTAIGRVLIDEGVLTAETVSMQAIRGWLTANPDRADWLFNHNAAYIFFDLIKGDGPIGSQGVVLTAGRSLAVDRRFIPLGAPLWLDSTAPTGPDGAEQPLRRLLIAQDTGGAILGPVRGDIYWGADAQAAAVAGLTKSRGRWFLLLPVGLDPIAALTGPGA